MHIGGILTKDYTAGDMGHGSEVPTTVYFL
jgi:hypothetical protein